MKIFAHILSRKNRRKSVLQTQQEILIKQGGDQFRKLLKKGLNVPVAYL